jgi:hypothetical protein
MGPDDLIFASVVKGRPMPDNEILIGFIKPAARQAADGLGELASLAASSCDVAETGWSRCARCAGADAAFESHDDARNLPAVRTRVAAESGRQMNELTGTALVQ